MKGIQIVRGDDDAVSNIVVSRVLAWGAKVGGVVIASLAVAAILALTKGTTTTKENTAALVTLTSRFDSFSEAQRVEAAAAALDREKVHAAIESIKRRLTLLDRRAD